MRPPSHCAVDASAPPFTFRFYVQDTDTITVNANGWIAMGDQTDHIIGTHTPIPAAPLPPSTP